MNTMKVPYGYCDLRVERVNDGIINTFIELNTTVNCSILGVGNSNRKKRKIAECNGENNEENDWIPTPKLINYDDSKLTIVNRLTVQISNIGQLHRIFNSQNFKLYNIFAVEPLNDQVFQDILTSSSIDIITCNIKTSVTPKQYTIAIEKNIYFEVSYAPMLVNYVARQDTLSLAHLLHIKGKSKNVIVSSGAVNKLDIRNPHDVMNLGILLGLSKKQSKESITRGCYSIILQSYGKKIGKSTINIVPRTANS
ncbi:ribonuclease P protein subunit p30-like isoform X2 [Rhopalosiphum padi]|uniref:ribonuclease P protein subunit p30-like isoform X2 n=1 Tax=Rhopalosiphum padi TaxID=40932 RepID=UPI00298E05B7|nr:ribonuclease P protein subunit p30-like isoform X2 [Rhopalosiphum padi]